jgi:acyl-CoA oxidase
LLQIQQAKDGGIKNILSDIARLYALSSIEADLSWYLTHQILSVKAGAAVPDLARAAVKTVAPQSLNIVDAFGIPEYLYQAPIAADYAKYNAGDNQGELIQAKL